MNTEQIFAVPIWARIIDSQEQQWIREEVSAVWDRLALHRDSARHSVQTTYRHTGSNDILEHQMQALLQVILESVSDYCQSLQTSGPLDLCESWVNIYESGGYMGDHEHPGCKISGIYYYQAEPGNGDLWFRNPNPLMMNRAWPSSVDPQQSYVRMPAQTGKLVLFPAWLTHSVSTCTGVKISIPFNFR
jgi:uncharacterized protein (TIGR02466 family)